MSTTAADMNKDTTISKKTMKSKTLNQVKCHSCSDPIEKILLCSRCLGAHYCSKTCQQTHWAAHKKCCKKINKQTHDLYLQVYYDCEAQVRAGEYVVAEARAREALRLANSLFHSTDTRLGAPLVLLAQVTQTLGDMPETIACLESAYVLYSNAYGSVSTKVQEVTFLLINALLSSCDWDKAFIYAEINYHILLDYEDECTCYLVAETARQLGAIYKHFRLHAKEEAMYLTAIQHYDRCPDLATRSRVDQNYEKYGGYIGLLRTQHQDLMARIRVSPCALCGVADPQEIVIDLLPQSATQL
jgi:tetratricopeptide (TPR) repeat protein